MVRQQVKYLRRRTTYDVSPPGVRESNERDLTHACSCYISIEESSVYIVYIVLDKVEPSNKLVSYELNPDESFDLEF